MSVFVLSCMYVIIYLGGFYLKNKYYVLAFSLLVVIVLNFAGCRNQDDRLLEGDFPNPGEERLDGTYRC